MNPLEQQIESLLFIAGKPLSVRKIADMLDEKPADVKEAAESLVDYYKEAGRGLHVMRVDQSYQMATSPETTDLIEAFIKSEQTGELTKPSLETLTIIAYRGPVAKAELEQIRGVNCSLILRNLLIRGLIEANFDRTLKTTVYQVTLEFLEFLGISRQEDLPEYEKLHNDTRLRELLERDLEQDNKNENKQDQPAQNKVDEVIEEEDEDNEDDEDDE